MAAAAGTTLVPSGCMRYVWPAAHLTQDHEEYWVHKLNQVDAEATALPEPRREDIFGPGPRLNDDLTLGNDRDPASANLLPMTLYSAIRIALENNQVIRQDTQFLSTTNPLLGTIDTTASVFDPLIQDTNVLFGSRGVGAAMADFVPTLSGNLQWNRDETVQNQFGLPTAQDSTTDFDVVLSKQLATGGSLALAHNIDYFGADGRAIGRNAYSGSVAATFTYPLLAASGTEFTQIAGPADFLVPRVTSVNQGILISRINSDIARLDLELNVRQLVRDVVNVYWDLTLAYGQYEAEEAALEATLTLFEQQEAKLETGQASAAELAQAEETFLSSMSRKQEALRSIDENEQRLRRLIGLPVSDGTLIRPADDPEIVPLPDNWNAVVLDSLQRRPQLKRTKFNLRSLQLQLKAARKLVKPRLDFVSSYRLNGFGDKLAEGDGAEPFDSFYDTVGTTDLEGWTLGVTFNMPLNFQLERSQVDNLELRVAKNRVQLAAQEAEISHEIAVALQNAQNHRQISATQKKRLKVAETLVEALEAENEAGRPALDRLVRAQATLAQAKIDYRRSLVEFSRANSELQYRRSVLLEANGINLQFSEVLAAHNYDCLDRIPIANQPVIRTGHSAADPLPDPIFRADPNFAGGHSTVRLPDLGEAAVPSSGLPGDSKSVVPLLPPVDLSDDEGAPIRGTPLPPPNVVDGERDNRPIPGRPGERDLPDAPPTRDGDRPSTPRLPGDGSRELPDAPPLRDRRLPDPDRSV